MMAITKDKITLIFGPPLFVKPSISKYVVAVYLKVKTRHTQICALA